MKVRRVNDPLAAAGGFGMHRHFLAVVRDANLAAASGSLTRRTFMASPA